MIYKGFQSYLRRAYQIDTRMADTGHALDRGGSSIGGAFLLEILRFP